MFGLASIMVLGATLCASVPTSTPEAAAGPKLPPPPASGEMGFVLTEFAPAVVPGAENCPDGLAGTLKENYLATLTEAERRRLLLKENEEELTKAWKATAFGPNRTNICSNPDLFPRPDLKKMVKSKVAIGLDLDGDATGKPAEGCEHENFTGVDGAVGVDNQMYRVMGCTRNWRAADGGIGELAIGMNTYLSSGEHTMVLLLRGVDSLENDPAVEVIWATTNDRPYIDGKRQILSGASFTVADNPRWRNVLKGRIRGGILETEPHDITLTHRVGVGGKRGANSEWDLRRGRIRVALQADGSIRGVAGAYVPPTMFMRNQIGGGNGSATNAGIDCATEYSTIVRHADGIRDPATGKCTMISVAMTMAGVQAFVNDRPELASLKGTAR
jgi:hypothetical protein